MGSDSSIKSVKEESESDCVNRCIDEFGYYNDTNTILRILEQTFLQKEIGEILGAEPKVIIKSGDRKKVCTPDALISLKAKHFLCVEIKAGDGGDLKGIVEELHKAAEYQNASSWQTGSQNNKIALADTLFICNQQYWKKINWLYKNDSDEIQSILNQDGFTILSWERKDDLIQIRRQHGVCRNQDIHSFLMNHTLIETTTLLLVHHARFLFVPIKPPVQYTAFMLLMTILPTWWTKAVPIGTDLDHKSRTASVDEIYTHAKRYFIPSREGDFDQIRMSWIEQGLDALVKCGHARFSDAQYTIKMKTRANRKQLLETICKRLCKKKRSTKKSKKKKRKKIIADENQSLLANHFGEESGKSE